MQRAELEEKQSEQQTLLYEQRPTGEADPCVERA